jgi:DNA/RNA-binding domain of Phe-tRNA-synthetase-like protein
MTELRVTTEVGEAFKELRIVAVMTDGFDGHQPWPEVDAALASMEEAVTSGQALAHGEEDPHIAAWYAAYRAFGTNPKRERPSVDALRRRLARSARLPRINPAVDCYNLISVVHGVPVGAFDLDAVEGDITVGFATGDEGFSPLGESDVTEHPRPGEVIYFDEGSVLTRHWNHRDADRTKVTADSTRILFLLETTDALTFADAVDAAAGDLAERLRIRSRGVATYWLTPDVPAADF